MSHTLAISTIVDLRESNLPVQLQFEIILSRTLKWFYHVKGHRHWIRFWKDFLKIFLIKFFFKVFDWLAILHPLLQRCLFFKCFQDFGKSSNKVLRKIFRQNGTQYSFPSNYPENVKLFFCLIILAVFFCLLFLNILSF